MKQAPCKDCENRGCGLHHDECEKYSEYRKEREMVYENRKRELEKKKADKDDNGKAPETSPTKSRKR